MKNADEKGLDALRIKKQAGRLEKLSSEVLAHIKSVLKEDTPKKYEIEGNTLTLCETDMVLCVL